MRPLPIVASLLLLTAGACMEREPDRLVIGTATDRPSGPATPEADDETRRVLDAKVKQICTLGYSPDAVRTLGAEDGQDIVTEDFRCGDYHLSFTPDFD